MSADKPFWYDPSKGAKVSAETRAAAYKWNTKHPVGGGANFTADPHLVEANKYGLIAPGTMHTIKKVDAIKSNGCLTFAIGFIAVGALIGSGVPNLIKFFNK